MLSCIILTRNIIFLTRFYCMKEKIGKRFKEIRTSLKKSQKEFAEMFGITQQNMSLYETGKLDLPNLIMVKLNEMGFDINWLLTGNGDISLKSPGKDQSEIEKENIHLKAKLDNTKSIIKKTINDLGEILE